MQGYFNRPDATAAALKDGWLHTGDLGRLDEAAGSSITGRRKEIIVLSSGKNIYPEEIEAAYRKSPFVKEICVLGLSRPGEPAAERLYAVVVPNQDVLRERKVANVGDLMRFEMEGASVHLPHHKRVLGYEIWTEPLPRTTTGKMRRFEVERRVRDATAKRESPGGPALSECRSGVAGAARAGADPGGDREARHVRAASLAPDANLELDLGLDSMERVELLTALEQRFGADMPEEQMQRLYTVRELSEGIREHSRGRWRRGGGHGTRCSLASAIDSAAFDGWLQPHCVRPGRAVRRVEGDPLLLRPECASTRGRGLDQLPATGRISSARIIRAISIRSSSSVALPYRIASPRSSSSAPASTSRRRCCLVRAAGQPRARRSGRRSGVGDAGRRRRAAARARTGAVSRRRALD